MNTEWIFLFAYFYCHISSEMVPRVSATEFRKNVDYSLYVLGSNFVFMGKWGWANVVDN